MVIAPGSIVATFPDFCWLVTMIVACSRLQDSKESGSRKVARNCMRSGERWSSGAFKQCFQYSPQGAEELFVTSDCS